MKKTTKKLDNYSKELAEIKENIRLLKENKLKDKEVESDDDDEQEKKKLEEDILKKSKDIVVEKELHVFWSKDKLKNIKDKFYAAGYKIKEKTKRDWDDVMADLKQGNIEDLKAKLLEEDFKTFYLLDIKKSNILEEILKFGHPETVL